MQLNKRFFQKTPSLPKVFRKNKKAVEELQEKWEEKRRSLVAEFETKHQETVNWLDEKGIDLEKVASKGSRTAAAGLAASLLVLANGSLPAKEAPKGAVSTRSDVHKIIGEVVAKQQINQALLKSLQENLPKNLGLTAVNETKVTEEISKITGVTVKAELDGNRLNTNYGKIGLEQHLPLYPGDNINEHFSNAAAARNYAASGMTANRGAFGYFAANKYALTQEALEQEKYYVVVQTFASPGWGKKPGLTQWYAHRKVLVVNTQTGAAIIGDIADSGPAKFTGKSFGGSPELMDQIGLYRGNRDAKVLLFFIDESQGNYKLGPI